MSEYLKREDVRRAVLHKEGDAVIAAIDELTPVKAITIEEFMHMVADEIPEQYARIAGQMVDFKTEDLTDAGRELLFGEKREEWIPVVRCKECIHRNVDGTCEEDTGDPYSLARESWKDDWFCADGKAAEHE